MEMNKESKDFNLQSLSAVENRLGKTIVGIKDTVKIEIENTLGSRLTNIEKNWLTLKTLNNFKLINTKRFVHKLGILCMKTMICKRKKKSWPLASSSLRRKTISVLKRLMTLSGMVGEKCSSFVVFHVMIRKIVNK